jgi:cytidylate kinase
MAVITVSKQLGAAGTEIAERVCEWLKLQYFDKRAIIEVAEEVGLSADGVVDFSEERYEVKTFLARLLRTGPRPVKTVSVRRRDASGRVTLSEETIDEVQYVSLIQSAIRAAYAKGDMVIVGRGGQAVLQDKPGVVHVRVIAPIGTRIGRLQEQYQISVEEAQQRILRQDRATGEYLGRFFGIQCDDPALYHLIVNTGKLDVEAAAQLIIDAVVQLRASTVS